MAKTKQKLPTDTVMNKAISKFDGWVDESPFINSDNESWPWFIKYDSNGKEVGDIKCLPHKYHSDWNWIAGVCQKILARPFTKPGDRMFVRESDHYISPMQRAAANLNLRELFIATYQFVKWYNANGKKLLLQKSKQKSNARNK